MPLRDFIVARLYRVVFAAHLDALIDDTSARLASAGVEHGIVQGGRAGNPTAPVQVCSLATLHRRPNAPPADLVIVDERHRALAATVRGVLARYSRADAILASMVKLVERSGWEVARIVLKEARFRVEELPKLSEAFREGYFKHEYAEPRRTRRRKRPS